MIRSWCVLLLALAGCGVSTGLPADGGPATGNVPVSCDLARQDCAGGQKCDSVCENSQHKIACTPEPAGAIAIEGAECSGTVRCVRGTGCFGGAISPKPQCVRYCNTAADCAGRACETRTIAMTCGISTSKTTIKLCAPP